MCKSLRTQAIELQDGFGFSDFILKDFIAKYNGDTYKRKCYLIRILIKSKVDTLFLYTIKF